MKRKGVALMLGAAAIKKASEQGVKKLYLESNTILKPAISLYHNWAFIK